MNFRLITPAGAPDCRLCRGTGVRSKGSKQTGAQRPCKCVTPEAIKDAVDAATQTNLVNMLRVDRG